LTVTLRDQRLQPLALPDCDPQIVEPFVRAPFSPDFATGRLEENEMNCAILSGAKIIRDRPLLARLSRFADGCFLALSARTPRIGKVGLGSN
jgi:hypothetical protein